MAAARQLAYYVTVTDQDGEIRTFGPGDTVPAWAADVISNDAAWVAGTDIGGEADGNAADSEAGKTPSYSAMRKAELEAEVDSRNSTRSADDQIEVEGAGTVADLIAALQADDASAGQ